MIIKYYKSDKRYVQKAMYLNLGSYTNDTYPILTDDQIKSVRNGLGSVISSEAIDQCGVDAIRHEVRRLVKMDVDITKSTLDDDYYLISLSKVQRNR